MNEIFPKILYDYMNMSYLIFSNTPSRKMDRVDSLTYYSYTWIMIWSKYTEYTMINLVQNLYVTNAREQTFHALSQLTDRMELKFQLTFAVLFSNVIQKY